MQAVDTNNQYIKDAKSSKYKFILNQIARTEITLQNYLLLQNNLLGECFPKFTCPSVWSCWDYDQMVQAIDQAYIKIWLAHLVSSDFEGKKNAIMSGNLFFSKDT